MIKKLSKIILVFTFFVIVSIPIVAQQDTSSLFKLSNSELVEVLAINESAVRALQNQPIEFFQVSSTQIDFTGYPSFAISCCCGIPGYYFYMNKQEGAKESDIKSARLGCIINTTVFTGIGFGIIYSNYFSNF